MIPKSICDDCIGKCMREAKSGDILPPITFCYAFKRRPKNNADRIREAKTSEELMEAIFHALKMSNNYTDSRVGMIRWLESETWDYPTIKNE